MSSNPPLPLESQSPALSPGTRFGGYEILQRLGGGGMGEVYRARDLRLEREVAIKTLPLDRSSQPEALARFEKEARSACALNHPNIVTIYELGQVNGTRYIAMELVNGETIRELLSSGPIPFRKMIAIAAQIADALAKAHEIGIVHRDLKPENLMVSGDAVIKVLDFGLAKPVAPNNAHKSEATTSITEHGTILGTLGYMSPEQANGDEVDFRSDQIGQNLSLPITLTNRKRRLPLPNMERSSALWAICRPSKPMATRSISAPIRSGKTCRSQ